MDSSISGTVGSTVGAAIAGPPGAIIGGLAGRLIAPLLDIDGIIAEIEAGLASDAVKWAWQKARRRRLPTDEMQRINGDLQSTFRDAIREALYDVGGGECFRDKWKTRRDVPAAMVYPQTTHGSSLWHTKSPLSEQICDCLQALVQALDTHKLLPEYPPLDTPNASVEPYLQATTPHLLNDAFFDQVFMPFLRSFESLLIEVPHFKQHLRRYLLDRTLVHLGELLKQRTSTWRAFNRYMLEDIRDGLKSLTETQATLQHQLETRFTELIAKVDSPAGSLALAELVTIWGKTEKHLDERFDHVLQRIGEHHREVIDRLVVQHREVIDHLNRQDDQLRSIQVGVGQILQREQISASTALHALPAPPSDFKGRADEIATLETALRAASADGTAAAISGVRGLGGIGKTVLATAVAQKLKPVFPDGQFFLELRGASATPMTPEAALRHILRAFRQAETEPRTLSELEGLYRSLLHGKRMLIVADDAKDAAQVRPLIPPAGNALLITSRRSVRLPGMPPPLELGKLPESDAIALVQEICPRAGAAAPSLAKLCGHLPLALRIAATFLARSTRPVERYLRELEDERKRLRRLEYNDLELDVEASFNLSFAALGAAAQSLLRQLGVFAASFDCGAIEDVVVLPEDTGDASLDDLLDELHDSSLLEYDDELDRYSLHDLVRVFALDRLREIEGEEPVRLRYVAYYVGVVRTAHALFLQGGLNMSQALALFDRERAHVDAAWSWVSAQPPAQRTDELLMLFADVTTYLGDLRYDKQRERIPQLEAAIAAARRQGQRLAEGVHLNNVGVAYKDLGDMHGALEYYQQARVIAQELRDRRLEGDTLANLGRSYLFLGKVQRALEYYQQAQVIADELNDHRLAGKVLNGLGLVYGDLGETQRAIEYNERALMIARGILGNRWEQVRLLGNLGNCYFDLGQMQSAIAYHEQRLALARELRDRRGESNALGDIGMAYARLGEWQRANQFCEQSLAIKLEIQDRRATGYSTNFVAVTYRGLGDLPRAVEFHNRALAALNAVDDRWGIARVLIDLGETYDLLGNSQAAIDAFEHGLATARETGDRRGESLATWGLGLIYEKQGAYRQAATCMQLTVDYERHINHVAAEQHAQHLEEVRQKLSATD
jgi:tetratricopeptide (TPR) repeat protein